MALSLYCAQCHALLATSDILMLATVPPSQNHVAVKRGKEEIAYERIRKIPNPNPKKASFCPFKVRCKQCPVDVGSINIVEEDTLVCFKVENVYFKRGSQEIKDKKLKKIKAQLIANGLEVVNVSLLSKMSSEVGGEGSNQGNSEPMVYCDKQALNSPQMRRLTRDKPREYQLELSQYALQENSLVYLPTGSGKTLIAAMVISCMKKLNPKKLMVFLTDRIPLVYQQSDYVKSQVPPLRVEILAGDVGRFPGDKSHWIKVVQALRENKVDLLVLTHQILLNFMDEENKVLKMTDISLLVFDEAHHCLGNHQYNQIMRDFYKRTPDRYKPLVLALTASPAGALKLEKTQENLAELLSNLCAHACMPVTSSDLSRYMNRPDTSYKIVGLSAKQQQLHQTLEDYLAFLRPLIEYATWCPGSLGGFRVSGPHFRGAVRKAMERCYGDKSKAGGLALGEHAMHVLSAMEISNILGCEHALGTLLDCLARIDSAATPMERLKRKLVSGSAEWLSMRDCVNRLQKETSLYGSRASDRYQELVKEVDIFMNQVHRDQMSRGIIFVKMRKTAYKLCELLRSIPAVADCLNPAFFVGHGGGSDGMEWRGEQEEVLKAFRSGQTKLLVSTSVLEEGLDVPICNLVIRFDSALTLRALVQSRGRASRRADSKFVVICVDSKEQEAADEAATKERNMEVAMRITIEQCLSQRRALQAERFRCQIRKPDFDAPQTEEATRVVQEGEPQEDQGLESATVHERGQNIDFESPKKKQKYVPQVKVTIVNVPVKDGSLDSQEMIQFFEEKFEVQSLQPESQGIDGHADIPSGTFQLTVEPREDAKIATKEQLFSHVIESWCSRGLQTSTQCAQMWLQRSDTPKRQRKQDKPVHVLKADDFVIGNLVTRTSFRSHWPEYHKPQSIRVAFEHDLRKMRVFFYVPNSSSRWKADLFQFEMHYSDLEEFVLIDKRKSSKTSRMLFTLRHPPRICRAKGFVEKDLEESTDFEDWYNDEEEEFDGWESGSDVLSSGSDDEHEKAEVTEAANPSNPEDLLAKFDVTSIDAVVNWERVTEVIGMRPGVLGRCLTYAVTLPEQSWPDAKELLSGIGRFDKRVFYTQVPEHTILSSTTHVNIPCDLSFDVKYAVQCLLSSYPVIYDRATARFGELLAGKPENLVMAALHKLGSSFERDKFCDPESKLESLLSQSNLRLSEIPSQLLPEHCAYIKRLVITPTRLLFYAPEIMSKNRVLRNYDPKNFICVNIRDEDFSRLSSAAGTIDQVLERVNKVLDEGVEPGGQQFLYLGSSNSQLRNHGCWFVRPSPHPDVIRQWMGDFTGIRTVATYCARMGQCFSTSMDAVGIDVSEGASWEEDEDVKTLDEEYCFSDGVGRISQELASVVSTKLGWSVVPSAFQVRFAGCKGVLALDPRLLGKTAHFRPSMRKFESVHRRLEVIQKSRPQSVYLNHQIILLLSNLGVPDDVFIKLQRQMLDNLSGMLLKERLAAQQMTTVASTGIAYKSLSEGGVGLTVEPFFKSLLVALYRERIQNMLSKARILVPPTVARLMMGVMDETGVLEPGQVFVQYSPPMSMEPNEDREFSSSNRSVLMGPVVVTRNPCLHPGDVRLLEAVDAPGLRHLVDCVVFPRKGLRPHPSEMGGGDLDGDLYFVCWDQDLLPRKPNIPPMNYESPPKKVEYEPITVRHMTKFFSEYIRSDQLGVIDNAHKAHADMEEHSVGSARCLDLAELHSLAVDAPKTGKWPEMPKDARVSTFPDFMMKSDKPSYPSSKVLGKLYRECRAFKDTISELPLQSAGIDSTLLVPKFQTYLEEAERLYDDYKDQLRTLMNLYGIESEAELITGCFRKLQNRLGREKTEIAEIVNRVLMMVRSTLRKKFFEEFGLDEKRRGGGEIITPAMKQKASAWYYVAYTPAHQRKQDAADQERTQFLSFPWLVYDVMLAIRKENVKVQTQGTANVAASVSQSLMKLHEEEKPSLLREFKQRVGVKAFLSKAVSNSCPGLALALFGSSATLLFRRDSDIDLCVLKSDLIAQRGSLDTKSQVEILRKLQPAMKKHFRKTRLVDSAQIPVLSCVKAIKRPGPLAKIPCDLSASWDGLLKAVLVSHYIKCHPGLLPSLRMLLRWGQQSGLTGHGKRTAGLNSNLLIFLMLTFCVAKGYIQDFNAESLWHHCHALSTGQLSDETLCSEWADVLREPEIQNQRDSRSQASKGVAVLGNAPIGEAMLSFFQTFNATVEKDIPDTFAGLLGVRKWAEMLSADHLQLLKEHMQRAFHLLALHADAKVLLSLSASEVHRVILLPQALSIVIAGNERHNAHLLSRKTGARVTIRPKFPGSGFGLVLDAIGSNSAVSAVERELDVLATQALRNKVRIMSVLFINEAKTMVLEGCHSDDEQVSLIPYYGEHHSRNDSASLFVPLLSNPSPPKISTGLAFTRHDFSTFQEKFLTQAQVIDKDYFKSVHGEMEFMVHFGRFYVFNVPKAFTEDTEPLTVSALQTNLHRGYTSWSASCLPSRVPRSKGPWKSRKARKKPERVTASDLKKKRKEKPSRSSFFTTVASREKAEAFFHRRRFAEVGSSEDFTVDIHSDHEFYVRFDQDLKFTELGYPKLRWCAIDVKRTWQEKADADVSELDGAETDVRFMLLTRRALGPSDIRGTDYEKYRDALEPASHVNTTTCPFEVKKEIWNDVVLIRHRKSRIFGLEPGLSSALFSDFRRSLSVRISDVTEYSRPTRDVSKFSKVLSRCEVSVQAGLPSNWVDGEEIKKLLRDIWAFAFAFSSDMSN